MAETTLMVSGGRKNNDPILYTALAQPIEQNKVIPDNSLGEKVQTFVSCGETTQEGNLLIVNPNNLKRCQPDEIGEIWVKSASVAQGYWHNETATSYAFNAYTSDTNEGPFLRTGDLGFCQDNQLFVTGRLKDLIIIRGSNYYPQDMELTIKKSDPAFQACDGVAVSFTISNEEKLVIVHEVQRTFLRHLDPDILFAKIRQCISEEFCLDVYAIALTKPGSIPKTSSGKVRRRTCKTMLLEKRLQTIAEWKLNKIEQA